MPLASSAPSSGSAASVTPGQVALPPMTAWLPAAQPSWIRLSVMVVEPIKKVMAWVRCAVAGLPHSTELITRTSPPWVKSALFMAPLRLFTKVACSTSTLASPPTPTMAMAPPGWPEADWLAEKVALRTSMRLVPPPSALLKMAPPYTAALLPLKLACSITGLLMPLLPLARLYTAPPLPPEAWVFSK